MLASRAIYPNTEQCIQFYFYHKPALAGTLNIYAKSLSEKNVSLGLPLWSEHVNNGYDGWQLAQVSLGHVTVEPFQAIFEEFVEGDKPGKMSFSF